MKLKNLFIRMSENAEIKSNKVRIPDYCLNKNKSKTKVKIREHVEFLKYLEELKSKKEVTEE